MAILVYKYSFLSLQLVSWLFMAESLTQEEQCIQCQECCEVEMEDLVDPMSDIDEADAGDPMAVSEYIQDIYSLYKTREVRFCISFLYTTLFAYRNSIHWKF